MSLITGSVFYCGFQASYKYFV